MTTEELVTYYADLLILQYKGKPKAYETIKTLVRPVIMDQLPTQVQNAFNLTGAMPAIGVQLDVLGKYAGVTRNGMGIEGPITLDDANFLSLVTMAIVRNNSESSLFAIDTILNNFFPDQVLAFDTTHMQMSYLVASTVGSQDLIQLFISENLLPKPMGVLLASIIYFPVIDKFFGFRTYLLPGAKNTPFNSYSDYQMDWPWLSYDYAIIL